MNVSPEWQARIAKACAVVVALICAFAAGTTFRPEPEIHDDFQATKTVQNWSKTIHDRAEDKVRVVIRDRWRAPDGTEREHTEEREATHIEEHAEVSAGGRTDETARREITVTPNRPAWHASLSVGAAFSFSPLAATPEIGGSLEHRIFDSPFFAGGQLSVRPTAMEFTLMAKASLQF